MDDPRDIAVRDRLKRVTKGLWQAVESPEKPGTFYLAIRGPFNVDTRLGPDIIVATLEGTNAAADAALLAALKEDLEWAMQQLPHLRDVAAARAADALYHQGEAEKHLAKLAGLGV